jgi:hypothetical protein
MTSSDPQKALELVKGVASMVKARLFKMMRDDL